MLLNSLSQETKRNIPAPRNLYLSVVKRNLTGPTATMEEQVGTGRFVLTDPKCPGHSFGRKQAGIARSLPKALIEMVIEECLHKKLNLDGRLLTTGTSINQ